VRECVRANRSRRPALDGTSAAAVGMTTPVPAEVDVGLDDRGDELADGCTESVYDAFATPPAVVPVAPQPTPTPGDVASRETLDADAALRAALRDAPADGVRFEELPGRVGRSRNWVHSRLLQLDAAGLAIKVARGRWRAREGRL
ncbi:MAG: hypothetical protein ACREQ5_32890, partial [Candidatus Dormibacteria bacterium]